MARYTKTDVVTGDVVKSDVNVQLGLIETAIADTLSRKGDSPNTMEADIDMDSNQILNLPDATTRQEPATYGQVLDQIDWSVAVGEAKYYDTVAAAISDTSLVAGDVVILKDRANGVFDVISGTGTANTYNIIAHGSLSLSLELRIEGSVIAPQFGAVESGDTTGAIQAAVDYAQISSFEYVELAGDYTVTNLEKLDEVKVISGDKPSTITIGATVFNVPYREETSGPTNLYVATTGSDSTNCGFDSTVPFATIQAALDYLPTNLAHDTVINIADGTYTDIGGTDEFGRPVNVDVSTKNISVLRDATLPLNDKAAKLIFRGASEAGTVVDGTDSSTSRYCFWCHENPGIQLENLTTKNAFWGVMSHQNSDVTLRDVTTVGHDFGRGVESNSRMEVLRGTNGTAAEPNTRNYFLKNGQLQENDSIQGPAVENGIQIDGDGWVYCLRVAMEATSAKNMVDSTGKSWMEFDDCNIYGGGNSFVVGSYTSLRFSNDCRVGDFTSGIFGNEAGYTDTDGLCHFYNNNFIAFITKGMPVFNLDNCDAVAASGTHDGSGNAAVLTDTTQDWVVDQFVGLTISNDTDGSTSTITANTATTITGVLAGGTDNDWDVSDAYSITAPNTNGVRIQGAATSVNLDPDMSSAGITSADKILSRPTSGLIYKGTAAPSDATVYYERGSIALNEAAAVGQPQGWLCTTRGYGGTAVFTAMPNL